MLRAIIEQLQPEISGQRAFDQLTEIVRHHRIQASPGYRRAAEHCHEAFRRAGLAADLVRHPADPQASFWAWRSFREWEARSAELWLTQPAGEAGKLADFEECAISLIQRSHPTPPGGLEVELAVVDAADRVESYEGRDVAGKLVLITGQAGLARYLAVEQRRALGLIVDQLPEWPPVRRRPDLPDARVYTSFWDAGEWSRPCFGFVLSPRQGDRLRRLAGQGPVRLRARVDSSFRTGSLENVEAVLPGRSTEEILLVAHACHPRPSANDNASGVAALLEAARAMNVVFRRGDLSAVRRTVRFLVVPELTGTFAYLASRDERIPRTIAGLNLDMVGQRQELCGSTLQVERPPRALPGFSGDLAGAVLDDLADEGANFLGSSRFALFRHAVTSFSGGSDHAILSDPLVGVSCPMVIQFPDRYYHTSEDTPDKVDPAMLARVALLAATYACALATAGAPEARWLARRMVSEFGRELQAAPRAALGRLLHAGGEGAAAELAAEADFARRRAAFLEERKTADLATLARLAGPAERPALQQYLQREGQEVKRQTQHHCRQLQDLTGSKVRSLTTDRPGRDSPALVPRRRWRGPISVSQHFGRLAPEERLRWLAFERDHRQLELYRNLALYWTDGTRTLGEIADLVELETGNRPIDYLAQSMELLAKLNLIDL
ncbi:MAG TPA: DUF4910 domain-containing protein [Bacillota bacterium]|nr:DUF4910 domain-containing protein [Bacillota bacterium]